MSANFKSYFGLLLLQATTTKKKESKLKKEKWSSKFVFDLFIFAPGQFLRNEFVYFSFQ